MRRATLAIAVVALVPAGCGGGQKKTTTSENPAKASFIRQADAICAQGNRATAPYETKISALVSQADSAKFFAQAPGLIRRATAVTRRYVDRLDAVQPAAADKAKIDAWRADVRHQVDLLDTTAEAIDAKDNQRVQALSNEVDSLNKRNDAFAKAYGMKACSETPS
jgi:hypothetical protein